MGQAEAALTLTYGPSGAGKTTDAIYSAPTATFLAAEGAVIPARRLVGTAVKRKDITTLKDATSAMEDMARTEKVSKDERPTMVVDDFSLLVEQSFNTITQTGWKFWEEIRKQILGFRMRAATLGINVLANAHEQPMKTQGKIVRGGPKLPSDLPEHMPATFNAVYRAVSDKSSKLWPYVYMTFPGSDAWVTKDRYHVVNGEPTPMNLREILLQADVTLKRAPGTEWMDDSVAKVAAMLKVTEPEAVNDLIREVHLKLTSKGRSVMHTRWVIRDALARATLNARMDDIDRIYGLKNHEQETL